MNNPIFVDGEDIPMVNQDGDYYEDYRTPDTSRLDETSFIETDTTEATSTLRLRQKVKRDKINALHRHLSVKDNPDLTDLDKFRLTKDPKKAVTIFEFYNGDRWVPLAKQTGNFFCCKNFKGYVCWDKRHKKFFRHRYKFLSGVFNNRQSFTKHTG